MINQETLKTFDKLYYETYNAVLKYVVCNCANIENVQDIVQNTYLEVLTKLKDKNTDLSKAYILGIARHKLNDYYRFNYKAKIVSLFSKKDSKEELNLIDNIPSNINIEKEVISKEDINHIWNYLKKKKVIISKIFYLYYYLDYNIKEIAKELNISESNVKNYLYRTLKELNILLSRGEFNEK
ncbi:MAG: sigma-70 family RNA polymerase sigma factor [Ruminococcus sp.]|nr:sigma-70 family RNA polymerase sigma factor [Ruminococcus sp.]